MIMTSFSATNGESSGIKINRKDLKQLMRRSDKPSLKWLAIWVAMLMVTGYALHLSLGTAWVYLTMLAYGTVLTVPCYSLSHECAHGTAFRSRWLNEALFWISSLLYFEEPYHRRYSHTRHHTYTWINGKDAQMPFATPMTLKGWLLEISGIAFLQFELGVFLRNALGKFANNVIDFTPNSELPKLKWSARLCLAIYVAATALCWYSGTLWPLIYIVIPRLVGGPVMLFFTLIQHVEMKEDQYDIRQSTRSFKTNWLGRFLYMNMNNHIEHHSYPTVPFYALPALNKLISDQLPQPDPGLFKTNLEVLSVVVRRSLGKNTKAKSIRQALQP
jgi:fatty acid desaturase